MMEIVVYYCADLNELNVPDSTSIEGLEIEFFGMLYALVVKSINDYGHLGWSITGHICNILDTQDSEDTA